MESKYTNGQTNRFRRPRRSISDESTISSTSSLIGLIENQTPYEEAQFKLAHDDRWRKEVSLGTRVGFYRLYRDVGKGNFSKVKMGVHYLTKGQYRMQVCKFSSTLYIT